MLNKNLLSERTVNKWDLSVDYFKVSTRAELNERPVQKATMTVCACLTALFHIPAGDYVQLKKRNWSLLTEVKADLSTEGIIPGP